MEGMAKIKAVYDYQIVWIANVVTPYLLRTQYLHPGTRMDLPNRGYSRDVGLD